MEQEIGFCRTSDGLTIAYATVGEGPPVVYTAGWPTHLELEWRAPASREFLEQLAQGCKLIRYDIRGSGLSDTDTDEFSLDALVGDLKAVIEHFSLKQFDLLSLGMMAGPTAMTYAAAYPEQVKRLVVASGFVRGSEISPPESAKVLIDYVRQFGFPNAEFMDDPSMDIATLRDLHKRQQEAGSPEVQGTLLELLYEADVSDILDQLTVPTLVLHGRDDAIPFRLGRDLAARLPNAKFVPFAGSSSSGITQVDQKLGPIREFLGLGPLTTATPAARDINTILFTDIVSSTALTQRLGDEKARDVLREHERIVREQLAAHAGAEVKTMGDGFMASFGSASGALECAIAMQKAFASYNEAAEEPVRIRVGLNAGEPIAEEDDLFGTAVILAARIAAKAEGGEILVSDVVRQLVAGKQFMFNDRGETELRGFEDPVRVYEARWGE
ncbi:MAG: adenylate/guanylate cyclase domain-containing protein [Chloroflexi bacterium]|nr:adenylate/guanylate cyclase domain-containing protein [Chloroflexota bacterium]